MRCLIKGLKTGRAKPYFFYVFIFNWLSTNITGAVNRDIFIWHKGRGGVSASILRSAEGSFVFLNPGSGYSSGNTVLNSKLEEVFTFLRIRTSPKFLCNSRRYFFLMKSVLKGIRHSEDVKTSSDDTRGFTDILSYFI